ncbi:hypothetical protein AB0G02_18295 [Actinosynnema sp. NPDC023658]|uniref:hypothetical protein n=1 Tax=Actinosynnema sp. NPDC023658 TaxID=3155465 RepID=UPI0033EECAAF
MAWSLVPAAPAGAAAGITITGLSVDMFPDKANAMWVDGTATCSTTGTATVNVWVSQEFAGSRAWGIGGTTVSCTDQPAHWSVYVPVLSLCTYPGGLGCFQSDSFADAAAWLYRNGVQEASHSGEFPTT